MNRLAQVMKTSTAHGRPVLVVYLTQGDPDPAGSVELVKAAAAAGADVVELGVPFSDPNADGPVIQRAMERALESGGGLESTLSAVAQLRAGRCDVPLVLFGYYNPIFVHGVERFADRCAEVGVDAVLTVDLPIDELDELATPLAARDVGVVPLVAPTSTDQRIGQVARLQPPFVYYISRTGITGSAFKGAAGGGDRVARIREQTGAPVAVGFGVKTPDDARALAKVADGVVVGSAIVERIESACGVAEACHAVAQLVRSLRQAMDDNHSSTQSH